MHTIEFGWKQIRETLAMSLLFACVYGWMLAL